MKAFDTNLPSRRGPVRTDNQDGPWSVSVAETPYDSRAYSLYIKTPTHNLTLTRTAVELVELDSKLRHSHSNLKIPPLPIDPETLPPPPKRKSNFLNTLSRLASPASAKTHRNLSTSRKLISTPQSEIQDPFGPFNTPSGEDSLSASATTSSDSPLAASTADSISASATSTAIAAYLTTVSNTPALRVDRLWKRFVRVRTDDLQSQRADKPIKRVRSDLAAHLGITTKDKENIHRYSTDSPTILLDEKVDDTSIVREQDITQDSIDYTTTPAATTANITLTADQGEGQDVTLPPVDDIKGEAATPVANDTQPSRIHRSQSADPDKRISRAYASSVPSQDGAESQTGDESSSSAALAPKRRRKKRNSSILAKEKSTEPRKSQRKVVIDDFEMMRVLGKGCAGKVLLVRHKNTADLFALKAITKRHVLAHQELQHTLTEQAVLKRMAAESRDPFVVKLWWSFHDKDNLFLVMDFHPGGDLATQLARWGRLGRDRARFYAAEIVEGVEGLHAAGVIYRDLKPENILIGADGHIVLTDFGLSKEFPRRVAAAANSGTSTPNGRGGEFYSSVPGSPQPATPPWMKQERNGELANGWPGQPIGHTDSTTTFCGTAEYLAPEVIQGLPYSYEVDWWSFGTMLYEMLTGITPFWAGNHSDMYVRVLQDELQFPDDRAIDQDTKSLIRGLLQRVPSLRICEPRIKKHPYFSMIDWSHVYYKRYIPPYIPPIDPSNASDTQNFDDTFLDMEPVLDEYNETGEMDTDQDMQTDTDRTDDEGTTPSQSRSSSSIRPIEGMQSLNDVTMNGGEGEIDVFDGYSFKGRHSVLIDGDDDDDDHSESGSGSESGSEEGVHSVTSGDGTSLVSGEGERDEDLSAILEQPLGPLVDNEEEEPKTPEARPPAALPPVVKPESDVATKEVIIEGEAVEPVEPSKKGKEKEVVIIEPATTRPPPPAVPTTPTTTTSTLPPITTTAPPLPAVPAGGRTTRPRREKSGVPALDKYLSDAVDDVEATEAERDEEDDDWDFIEAADGEDRNGAKGNSLFARGVVDRYRLAVFRKTSTPNGNNTVSGSPESKSKSKKKALRKRKEEEDAGTPAASPLRGRTPGGLSFRSKNTRPFLKPKSPPPSSYSAKSSLTARSVSASASLGLQQANSQHANSTPTMSSFASSSIAPSLSVGSSTFGIPLSMPPSLKSKESAMSMGARSQSSEQSAGKGDTSAVLVDHTDTLSLGPPSSPPPQQPGKVKNKKLRKYKNNAEKVFSLFSSPKPQQQQTS